MQYVTIGEYVIETIGFLDDINSEKAHMPFIEVCAMFDGL